MNTSFEIHCKIKKNTFFIIPMSKKRYEIKQNDNKAVYSDIALGVEKQEKKN